MLSISLCLGVEVFVDVSFIFLGIVFSLVVVLVDLLELIEFGVDVLRQLLAIGGWSVCVNLDGSGLGGSRNLLGARDNSFVSCFLFGISRLLLVSLGSDESAGDSLLVLGVFECDVWSLV